MPGERKVNIRNPSLSLRLLLFVCLFPLGSCLLSQHFVVGEFDSYVTTLHEERYVPNAKISFDIDSDGVQDLNIRSTGTIDIHSPWERLSFGMTDQVEVLNSGVSLVTTFELGDTVPTDHSYYTENLDFFYGTGAVGGYRRYSIEEKYIVYSKKSMADTSYIFIKFSHEGLEFTVHKIVTSCEINPLEVITPTTNIDTQENVWIYPNPAFDMINLSEKDKRLEIFSMNGRIIAGISNPNHAVNIDNLNTGT